MTEQTTEGGIEQPPQGALVRVWSPVIRIVHWTLVAAFAVAWLTEDDLLQAHVWAGYVAAVAVLLRLIWGFAGPERDRFTQFLRPPGEVLRYLRDAVSLRGRRYIGHSPAGAAMAVAVLLSMAATAGTGMVTLAETKNAGPLAPWFGGTAGRAGLTLVTPAWADGHEHEGHRREHGGHGESAMKEIHEFLAYLTLMLVLLHVGGVALASLSHRENLVRSMITGHKRADPV
jgi:cytochrome b